MLTPFEGSSIAAEIMEGSRNSTLTSLAGSMRARGMTEEGIYAALLAENIARCNPPLEESEVKTIAHSVSRYQPNPPQKKYYHRTDSGNAESLRDRFGSIIRYCPAFKYWLVYDGCCWKRETGELTQFAIKTAREMLAEASRIESVVTPDGDGDETYTYTYTLTGNLLNNLNLIISSGRRLSRLVNDLLDFSRIKNNDIVLKIEPVYLGQTVQRVLALSRSLIRNKELTLKSEITDDLIVEADENLLEQILHNLVSNAIKYTPAGSITVSASVKEKTAEISVKDTGIGIPEEYLDRIFEPYKKAKSQNFRKANGLGIGLNITKNLLSFKAEI